MVVKMAAAVAAAALLLLCCSVTANEGCDTPAPTNGNFTLPLTFQVKPSDTLKWFRNNINIHRRSKEYLFDNNKKTRVSANGSLEFVGINNNDKGLYKVEVIREGNAIYMKEAKVCLMDPVTTPNLTMECLKTTVKFTCKVESKSLKITWMQNDKVLEKEKAMTLTRTVKQVLQDNFKCKSSNAVSSQTSKPLTQNCVTYLFGQENWIMMIILGGGGGLVLVLIFIVIVCCCRARRKKSMKVKDEEELRLGWTDTQQQAQQQQHHFHGQCHHPPSNRQPHRQQQQQPPGHTGPRQHRSKPPRDPQRDGQPQLPRPRGQPRPSPRGPPQRSKAADDEEQPPPLPQPRRTTNKVV